MRFKSWLLAGAAALTFTLAGAQPARADHGHDRRECYRKIEKQEYKLEKEIRKHGYYSRQAQREREKLFRIRRECGRHLGWGRDGRWRDNDWRDDDWRRRDDDRYGRDRRWGRWDHDPDHCRDYGHRHDRDGGFRWGGTFWLRIR